MSAAVQWGLWLGTTLASFGWFEYQAVKDRDEREAEGKRSETLTSTMRAWMGIDPPRWWRWICGPLFGAFCFYLFTHFLFGWFMF